ncbi:hypothetical protein [Ralstonia solanacearum]|uniref:hypothetical protein n=1 Tax=Ralstonia solanacearum TaxID=305 RepID=UPI0005AC9200|nr:hypothetical protein [Ralstonia solanacearum]
MIVCYDGKLGNGKSLSGLFQLTGVAMVDPYDTYTDDLLRLQRQLMRNALFDYVREMHACRAHGLYVARYYMEQQVREQILSLGGLASPW